MKYLIYDHENKQTTFIDTSTAENVKYLKWLKSYQQFMDRLKKDKEKWLKKEKKRCKEICNEM